MRVTVMLLIFTVVSFVQVYSQEAAVYQGPEYKTIPGLYPLVRNFAGMGHGGSKCIYCHAFIMPDKEYEQKFLRSGCRCHQAARASGYKINMQKVRELHDSNHCRLCHAGTRNVTFEIYHKKVHRAVPCTKCHEIINATEFKITKPRTMRCKACHNYDIHFIHSNVLGKVCKLCHGKAFASRYTRKDLEKLNLPEETINKTLNVNQTQEVKPRGFITISKILAFIIDIIF